MNGANGMSDIEGSEPRWRSCEGSSEWQRVTTEFAKLGRGELKPLISCVDGTGNGMSEVVKTAHSFRLGSSASRAAGGKTEFPVKYFVAIVRASFRSCRASAPLSGNQQRRKKSRTRAEPPGCCSTHGNTGGSESVRLRTSSGCSVAKRSAASPPYEWPTKCTRPR